MNLARIKKQVLQMRKPYIVYIALFFIAWLFLGSSLTALIVSLLLSYKIIERFTNENIFDSKFFLSVIAAFFYAVILQCVALSVWLISRNFPLDSTIYITPIFLFASYAYLHRTDPKKTSKHSRIFTSTDIIGVVIGLIIVTGIFLMPVIKGGFSLSTISISSINASIDDGHHIEFINDRLQFNRGILFHSNAVGELKNQDAVSSYPAGWHSANAVLIDAFNPKISIGSQSIVAYMMTKIFWYFVLLFIFTKVIFIVYKLFSQKPIDPLVTVWLSIGSLMFIFFFLLAPFRQGFYSFLPQLTSVLLLGLALVQMASNFKNSIIYKRSLILAFLLCIGGGLSWILVLPGMALAILVLAGVYLYSNGTASGLRDSIAGVLSHLPFYLLLFAAVFAQFYVMAKSKTTIPFIEHLTTPGSIEVYMETFYVFIIVGILLCGMLLNDRARAYLKSYLVLLSSLLLITAAIGLIHFFHLFDYGYYYYKALNVFTIVALPIALAGFGLLIKKYTDKNGLFVGSFTVAILLLATVQIVGPNPGYPNGLIGGSVHGQIAREEIDYIKGTRVMPYSSVDTLWSVLESSQNNHKDNVTIFYNEGMVSQNEIMTLITKTNMKQSECNRALNLNLHKASTIDTLLGFIRVYCQNNAVDIITDQNNLAKFQESAGDNIHNLTIVAK